MTHPLNLAFSCVQADILAQEDRSGGHQKDGINPQGTMNIKSGQSLCSTSPSSFPSASRTKITSRQTGVKVKIQSFEAAETAALIPTELTDVMSLFSN